MKKVAAVILAGGKSTRMGRDKSTIKYQGQNLLNHCQQILKSSQVSEIFISNKDNIADQVENLGPIGGVFSCLEYLKPYDFVIFTPVDMPLITPQIFNYLFNEPMASMAYFKGFHMPFIIRNNKEIRLEIKQLIEKKKLAIYQLINKLNAQAIEFNAQKDFDESNFVNVNHPEQLQKLKN